MQKSSTKTAWYFFETITCYSGITFCSLNKRIIHNFVLSILNYCCSFGPFRLWNPSILGFYLIYFVYGKCEIILLLLLYISCCTGCSGKNVFFHSSLQPLSRLHRCESPPKLSKPCECTVTPIGWLIFCTTNRSRVLTRERWQTFENSWEKNNI